MTTPAIHLHQLTIGYDARHPIATGLSADLYRGELTCLFGTNGVGKTTLLRTLSQPGADGKRRSDISIVLTDRPDVQRLTVEEVVGLGRTPYTNFWGTLSEEDRRIVSESLTTVGIRKLRSRLFCQLSDGERQKVMVAKALAQQTPIILLDEPTAFLDFRSRVEMFRLLSRLAHDEGKAILLATHDVELALQLGDRFWLMEQGRPLTVGTAEELRASGAIARYIGEENMKLINP